MSAKKRQPKIGTNLYLTTSGRHTYDNSEAHWQVSTMKDLSRMIYEELKHLRVIHFTLLIVCCLNLYLVYQADSNLDAFNREVLDLNGILDKLTSNDSDFPPEAYLGFFIHQETQGRRPALKNPFAESEKIKKEIQLLIAKHAQVTVQNNLILITPQNFVRHDVRGILSEQNIKGQSLETIRGSFLKMASTVTFPNHLIIDEETIQKLKAMVLSIKGADVMEGPLTAQLTIKEWPSVNRHGLMKVSLGPFQLMGALGGQEEYTVNRGAGNPRIPEIGYPSAVSFLVPFKADQEELKLHEFWFESKFPQLSQNWLSIKDEKIESAVENAKLKRLLGVPNQKFVSLLNFEVRGRDLGTLGPILIFTILFYMLSYVSHMASRPFWSLPKTTESSTDSEDWRRSFIAPWIGVVPNLLGVLVSIATLAILPSFAIMYELLTLADWNAIVVFAVTVVCFVLGMAVFNLAQTLRKAIFGEEEETWQELLPKGFSKQAEAAAPGFLKPWIRHLFLPKPRH